MVVENESQSQETGEKLTEEKEVLNNKVAVDMMQKVAGEAEREEEGKKNLLTLRTARISWEIKRRMMFLSHRSRLRQR
jgi:hypothetical protein